jgi:hypothetical protein
VTISHTRLRKLRELEQRHKHRDCPCGCGELADECAGPSRNPLAPFDIDAPERAIRIHLDDETDD